MQTYDYIYIGIDCFEFEAFVSGTKQKRCLFSYQLFQSDVFRNKCRQEFYILDQTFESLSLADTAFREALIASLEDLYQQRGECFVEFGCLETLWDRYNQRLRIQPHGEHDQEFRYPDLVKTFREDLAVATQLRNHVITLNTLDTKEYKYDFMVKPLVSQRQKKVQDYKIRLKQQALYGGRQ